MLCGQGFGAIYGQSNNPLCNVYKMNFNGGHVEQCDIESIISYALFKKNLFVQFVICFIF